MQGRRPQATNRGRLPAACVSASACRLSLALCLTSAFGISGGSVAGLQRVAASARLLSDACLSTITREKFEELCEDFWEQALSPVKEVLAHSGMKIDDIYAVELIGGATRVPKLQAKLQQFLGWSELDKHLDADEAIVLGASLHAANLSDVIKLNRKLGMIDGSTYGFVLEIDGPDYVKDESID